MRTLEGPITGLRGNAEPWVAQEVVQGVAPLRPTGTAPSIGQ